ncbi:Thiolase, N-terminal domain-containing protein [Gamsiella multidivaricata]|uniref:Thiolase, N-terminal domain-containing protein n=1 Tax=Gamsiella multidivaricata TaxID=101098 RepID=UPI00221F0E98|nr:Thiolase, N-terminal domain-containing protein [Gamsiella multidivaricata]KAI7824375.1 Thiolase, N-terminal domain-containing protein [Gamsiella multidivaricata]
MSSRLAQISSHLTIQPTAAEASEIRTKIGVKSPDDVVIVDAVRTPMTRGKKGGFKDTVPEDLLAAVLIAIKDRTKIDPALVDDICVGNVLQAAGGATVSRMAALYAGYPEKTSIYTTNRQCSSGLQAVVNIATHIQAGLIDIGIGAGVESMTMGYGPSAMASQTSEKIPDACEPAADCQLPMGITSENVASEFNVTREKQDQFAALSFAKASKAQAEGKFDSEIVAVKTTIKDENDNEKEIIVSKDDGIRAGTTVEKLAKLRPAFDGATTAGNASQVSDGAAAVLLMKRKTAERLGLPIQGKYIASAVVGCPPKIMGVGPAVAIPAVCKKAGVKIEDIDVFELNEAFASQAVYSIEKCGLDINKVNPVGGAIAMGHPLGCTGARQIATILPELKRQGKKLGLTTMCIGTGMGMACIIERE